MNARGIICQVDDPQGALRPDLRLLITAHELAWKGKTMELYIADSFTDRIFGGNQAGVVLLDSAAAYPADTLMQQIAAELKHSETAFVKRVDVQHFTIRYFTPGGEVDLCGHATIAAFTVLREEKALPCGKYMAATAAGMVPISIEPDRIWMGMTAGKYLRGFSDDESSMLYQAYGLSMEDKPEALQPCLVSTGLSDILLPVQSAEKLAHAVQNKEEVIRLTQKYQAIGVHMYYPERSANVTARCRNFAPRFGIDEEAATGTSNGALTFYLHSLGLILPEEENVFLQGESMGKPSIIRSRVRDNHEIYIGGNAVISIRGCLNLKSK